MNLDFANAFVWFTAFLFSTTVHEAMHAFVAWRLGDPTAYNGGQVTLSPVPHVAREPIGMLVLPLLTSFTQGWAGFARSNRIPLYRCSAGLFIAWQVFPMVTDPLFSTLLWIVHPGETYS